MRDLTKGNIYINFILFSFPIMITGFLMQIFSAVDTAIAGKMLGENAIAAIGATSSLITLLSCATSGYTIGFSIYIAKLFGAKRYNKIKQNFYSVLIISGCFYFVLLSTLILLRTPLMNILEVGPEIIKDANTYFTVYCITLIFMLLRSFFTYFLHALGDTVYPLVISMIASVVHIVCSLVFILIIKGPFASVLGLALANTVSVSLACILLFGKVKNYFKLLDIKVPFKFELRSSISIFQYALPTMIQQIIMYTSDVFVSPLINRLGVTQLSAYSVSSKIKVISEQTFCSSSKAVSNYAAQCIGAGKPKKIKKGVGACAVQGMLTLLPIVILCVIFSGNIASLFFEKKDVEGMAYVMSFLKIYMPLMFFNVINNLFHSFFRGIKAMKYLLFTTSVGSISKYIFSLLLVGKYEFHGVWMAIVTAWIIEAVICVVMYFSGIWEKYTEIQPDISIKKASKV